jgi:hypothetical protein
MAKDRDRPPTVPAPAYVYRRTLAGSELLPAIGVGVALGLGAFYVTRLFLQRTPLEPPPATGRSRAPRRAAD